jgi:dTMP kinase
MSTTERRGFFISFEGIDGAGKSTQIRRLVERLRLSGRDVVETVEPGASRIARQIRQVLLDPANAEMSPVAEMLLYFAARAQNASELIRPALARGAIVVSDRFTDSTIAYQGYARGLGEALVRELHEIACPGLTPDLTILLDIDPAVSAQRRRGADRLENEPDEFRSRVREGYLRLAAREPDRIHAIDGVQSPDAVAGEIWRLVEPHV